MVMLAVFLFLLKLIFNHVKIDQFSYATETIEICCVKISSSNSYTNILGIYRPHSDNIGNFSLALENIINHSQLSNASCVIAGDLNINLMSNAGDVELFADMMRTHHYIQTITGVTRSGCGRSTPSLIDHIWINQLCNYNSGVLQTGITDHFTLFIQLPFFQEKKKTWKK